MKKQTITLLIVLLSFTIQAQLYPDLSWQLCLGGTNYEAATAACITADDNYFIVGHTASNDGQVVGNHGNLDYWSVKTNEGSLLAQIPLGGSEIDECYDVKQTPDNGFILVGKSTSNDGQVTGNHGNSDIWVVKLLETGNIEWQKSLGGSELDNGYSVGLTADGGYIVGGTTLSTDGDVMGNHGETDIWIIKLTATGDISWQNCYGGTDWDGCQEVKQTVDNGFIIAGYTGSNNGDVTGNHGGTDYWVVKTDNLGNIEWQKCLGGSLYDEASEIMEVSDGYFVFGSAASDDGDVTGNHGQTDFWLVKINNTGDIMWSRCYGGSGYDDGEALTIGTDGHIVLTGATNSVDGDISLHIGGYDFWVVNVDGSDGNLLWEMSLGGQQDDGANDIIPLDMGYLIAGLSFSDDGHVSGNHGGGDYWLARLEYTDKVDNYNTNDINVFPVPVVDGILTVEGNNLLSVEIISITGLTVFSSEITQSSKQIDISQLNKGLYFVRIYTVPEIVVKKVIVR